MDAFWICFESGVNRISYRPVKGRKARRIKLSYSGLEWTIKNIFEEKNRSLILEIIVLRWTC